MNNDDNAIATSYILRDARTHEFVGVVPALHPNSSTYAQEYTHQLIDAETLEHIRPATVAELRASRNAEPKGHIDVNGRRCFVD